MADAREGRYPKQRRQRYRLQFPDPTPAQQQPIPQRTSLISPLTVKEQRLDRLSQRTVQLEQNTPANQATSISRKDTRFKPYVSQPPSNAAAYPKGKFADFYPWVLNPTEDAVTEQQARVGHFDKLHGAAGKNESVSARPALQQILKQKSGLPALSQLFLTVLEKRNELNNITTPSTFKPPPRVSLVDTRRESWLEDLANPAVPLRKLSRTIPHGIKGRALLDQCLAKNVPLNRAVWFARCVGANELRGLKRKGTGSFVGSEIRWVREWTVQLAQFVEAHLTEPQLDEHRIPPRKRINYVLRLAGYLHMEKLLEPATFMEYHLRLLKRCGLDKLPAALLMCGTLQKGIFTDRVYGRHFYEALLSSVKSIAELKHRHIYTPLFQKVSVLLRSHLLYNIEALLLPDSWESLKGSLLLSVNWWNPQTGSCLRNADSRNKTLNAPSTSNGGTSDQATELLRILDTLVMPFDAETLLSNFEATCYDYKMLIETIVEWAVSSFRAGTYRVYIACALLRSAVPKCSDLQTLLLEAFESRITNSPEKLRMFYHLVSELTRIRVFSVAQFVKWAVVRGVLRANTPHIHLLSELPLVDLPLSIKNLRNTLLSTAGFDAASEQWKLAATQELLTEKLNKLTSENKPASPELLLDQDEEEFIKGLSGAVMVDVSLWLKRTMQGIFDSTLPNGLGASPAMSNGSIAIAGAAMGAFVFCTSILEKLDDMRTLSEIVIASSCSNDEEVLCFAAGLASLHFESFSALGESQNCLLLLYQKYGILKTSGVFPHRLCQVLFELALYAGQDPQIASQLNIDMYQFIRSVSLAKYMKADMDGGEPTFDQVFSTCILELERQVDGRNPEHFLSLRRLRQADDKSYNEKIKTWACNMLQGSDRQVVVQKFAQTIAWSCMDFENLVAAVIQAQSLMRNGASARIKVTDLSLDALSLLLGDCSDVNLDTLTRLSIRAKSELFILSNPRGLLGLLHICITLGLSRPESLQADRLRSLLSSQPLTYVLKRICACDSQLVATCLVNPVLMEGNAASNALIAVLNSLLVHKSAESEISFTGEFCNILEVIDSLSISPCELKLRILCDSIGELPDGSEFVERLGKSIDRAKMVDLLDTFPRKCAAISLLLTRLDAKCKQKVYWFAEQLLLHSDAQRSLPTSISDIELKQNEKYILAQFILCILEEASPPTVAKQQINDVFDKLGQIISKLSSTKHDPNSFSISLLWIRSLISDLVKYQALLSKETSIPSDIGFLIFNYVQFIQQKAHIYSEDSMLMDTIYDVCGALIDICPAEILNSLRIFFRDRPACPRVNYLFGLPSFSDRWLKASLPNSARAVDYPVKAWEKLAEPSPNPGENDVCISLTLFATRKVRCA